MNKIIPLNRRKGDIAILVFFIFNLLFISYLIDLEQVVISNASNFIYPVWPPKAIIDLMHWYGRTYDPLIFARPVWWKMTIWMDVILFGPFYLTAIYAFIKGKEWIKIPSIIISTMLITNVIIIFGEEICGTYPTHHLPMVIMSNLPWVLFPLFIIWRMSRSEHPFNEAEKRSEHSRIIQSTAQDNEAALRSEENNHE